MRLLKLPFVCACVIFFFPQIAKPSDIDLTELLDSLRNQLKALEEAGRKDPMWRVKEATLKAQFVLVKKGEAGVKALITVGGEYSKEAVQEITLNLTPLKTLKVEIDPEYQRVLELTDKVDENINKLNEATSRAEVAAEKAEGATRKLEIIIKKGTEG
jgi:hypothetical protein